MAPRIVKVDPFDLVVFGGTGDLAYRKLYPALFHRERSDQFSEPTRIIGVSRRASRPRRVPRPREGRARQVRRGGPTTRARRSSASSPASTTSRSTRPASGLDRAQRRCSDPTSASAPSISRRAPISSARSPSGSARRGCRRRSRASSSRSRSATTATARDGDQRRGRRGLPGEQHLPHRPLSRQGDGAEPDGAALRQRAVRAAVERRAISTTCRSPSPRRSASRGAAAITTSPARCATWCRTTCCSCSAWSRWSRRLAATPTRCATRS